jgi:membrane protein
MHFFRNAFSFTREAGQEWVGDKATQYAAALAFFTMLSLAPLLLIGVSIAGFVLGEGQARTNLLSQVRSGAGSQVANAVGSILDNAQHPGSGIAALVIGVILLLLGASGAVGMLRTALNAMWDIDERPVDGFWNKVKHFVGTRLFYIAVVLSIGLGLLVLLGVSAIWSWVAAKIGGSLPAAGFFLRLGDFIVTLGLLTLLFAALFRFLAEARPARRDLWPGAFVTAVLFDIGRLGIGLYMSLSSTTSSFGAAGSLVALLLWLYYSAMIVFFGAEFTQVYARHRGRQLVLAEGAAHEGSEAAAEEPAAAGQDEERSRRPAA